MFDLRWREVFLLMAGLSQEGTALVEAMRQKLRQWWGTVPKIRRFVEWSASVAADGGDGALVTARRLAVLSMARLQTTLRGLTSSDKLDFINSANYDIVLARDLIAMLCPRLAQEIGIAEDFVWDVSRYVQVDQTTNLEFIQVLDRARLFKPGICDELRVGLASVHELTYRPFNLAKLEGGEVSLPFGPTADAWLRAMRLPEELWCWTEDEAIALVIGLHAMELIVECHEAARIPTASWSAIASFCLAPL